MQTTINSGIYKGKKLNLPSLNTTRSTKNLVKSSFFDTMRFELKNLVFIECFGGSGVMAAEALSNGAKMAFAIEKDKKAFEILDKNLSFSPNLKAVSGDSFEKINKILDDINDEILLFLDPPFSIRDGFGEIYQKCIEMVKKFQYKNIKFIVFESESEVQFPQMLGNFIKFKDKKFGKTSLIYYEFKRNFR